MSSHIEMKRNEIDWNSQKLIITCIYHIDMFDKNSLRALNVLPLDFV